MGGDTYNIGYSIGTVIGNLICIVAPIVIIAIAAYVIIKKNKAKKQAGGNKPS